MNNKKASPEIWNTYKELITTRQFKELEKLVASSQTPPPEEIVHNGYQSYMEEQEEEKTKLFAVAALKQVTKIKPQQTIIISVCEICLGMNKPEILESLVKHLEIDKETFQGFEFLLQNAYSTYIADGKFMEVSILMGITGVDPQEEAVQKGYKGYLEQRKLISFSGLKKRTGFIPDEEMIEATYHQYHSNHLLHKNKKDEEAANSWLDYIRKLERISKIKPKNQALNQALMNG
ncbi:MAG: hypothetical protein GY940_04855 [bacterium]|nr:hypothetical protein [bacterium]